MSFEDDLFSGAFTVSSKEGNGVDVTVVQLAPNHSKC